jgi:hypothetical protein
MKQYLVSVKEPSAMGDYTYMSKLIGVKIKTTNVQRGTLDGRTIASPEVLARWQSIGFYPSRELADIAVRSFQQIGFSWV